MCLLTLNFAIQSRFYKLLNMKNIAAYHYSFYIDIDKPRKLYSESVVSREASYNKMYRASYKPEQLLDTPLTLCFHPIDICAVLPSHDTHTRSTCESLHSHTQRVSGMHLSIHRCMCSKHP